MPPIEYVYPRTALRTNAGCVVSLSQTSKLLIDFKNKSSVHDRSVVKLKAGHDRFRHIQV